jgi:hypothetical protein
MLIRLGRLVCKSTRDALQFLLQRGCLFSESGLLLLALLHQKSNLCFQPRNRVLPWNEATLTTIGT